jgi:hypothetical protein
MKYPQFAYEGSENVVAALNAAATSTGRADVWR